MSDSDSFWLKVWEWVSTISVVVVIVGIIGEGAELLLKFANKKKYKRLQRGWGIQFRWHLAGLMKFVRPRLLEVETFAFALVVLGLVGEFWGSQKEKQILDRNNAQLNLAAKQLGKSNAQLVADNLVLRSNVVELEAKLQWRTINPTQEVNLVEHLSSLVKQHIGESNVVVLEVEQSDFEAVRYARSITTTLRKCGFVVFLNSGMSMAQDPSVPIPDGIGIGVTDHRNLPWYANPVLIAFRNVGITPFFYAKQPDRMHPDDNFLYIGVWHKPEK